MSASVDAVVIGGSVGGLVASIYLRRAGRTVLLLEAEETAGGECRAASSLAGVRAAAGACALSALDPRVVDELGLLNRGLTFVARDLPLAVLWAEGKSLILSRDQQEAGRAIAAHSAADAERYKRYRRELFELARTLRPWWWEDAPGPVAPRRQRALLERLEVTSAAGYLNSWFDSDILKASLAFDAVAPFEAGSALALVWRAAQEMCGLQGAVAIPRGGPLALVDALVALARECGVDIRNDTRATRLNLDGYAIAGVELDSGETVSCGSALSSLSRRTTLLDLAPEGSAGFAETERLACSAPHRGVAHVILVLDAVPDLGAVPLSTRIVMTEQLEAWLNVDVAAHEGCLPDELMLEIMVPTVMDPELAPPGQHVLAVRVCGLPVEPLGGWQALSIKLAERVVSALERRVRNLRAHIIGIQIAVPDASVRDVDFSLQRVLQPYAQRIATPIDGLFLCGEFAEPMDAVSGRAGRLSAGMAQAWLARASVP
jgi:phytoene dehydrogenase-like protein